MSRRGDYIRKLFQNESKMDMFIKSQDYITKFNREIPHLIVEEDYITIAKILAKFNVSKIVVSDLTFNLGKKIYETHDKSRDFLTYMYLGTKLYILDVEKSQKYFQNLLLFEELNEILESVSTLDSEEIPQPSFDSLAAVVDYTYKRICIVLEENLILTRKVENDIDKRIAEYKNMELYC